MKKLPERAAKTQERQYPGNYVIAFVEGDGVSFDYGIDYLECGGCKFLESQGAFELARYICPIDIVYSEALGWGLTRTQTIADGGETCDFRFVPRLLPSKIVAGETQHRQPAFMIALMKRFEPFVLRGETAARGDIDDKKNPPLVVPPFHRLAGNILEIVFCWS